MTPTENPEPSMPAEPLALSLLNDFLFCPRRAALKVVEGWREANVHTELGDIVHEHTDLAGYEHAKGVKLIRALPVFSDRLGLSGKCDIVEVHPNAAPGETLPPDERGIGRLYPVEFKVGRRRQWENDDVQLCAQALCLEEMFGRAVPRGAVFHAESKRRREVEFTPELRQVTTDAVHALHALAAHHAPEFPLELPPAVFKPACKQCSLYAICLPQVISQPDRLARAARALFEI